MPTCSLSVFLLSTCNESVNHNLKSSIIDDDKIKGELCKASARPSTHTQLDQGLIEIQYSTRHPTETHSWLGHSLIEVQHLIESRPTEFFFFFPSPCNIFLSQIMSLWQLYLEI